VFAAIFSGVLFELEEHVLASSNREAQRLNAAIRGWPVQSFGVLDRRWIVGTGGDIYHYEFFDQSQNRFARMFVYDVNEKDWRLDGITYANDVTLARQIAGEGEPTATWLAHNGWTRQFSTTTRRNVARTTVNYEGFGERPVALEPPKFFSTEEPDADRITYGELKHYIGQLQTSGYHVVNYIVQLHRKVAFPFVTVIMTLLAVPFAVTTGRRGALYGVGVGIVLAILYWIALSVFVALGSGGVMSPMLAAWSPNILFGAAAAVLLLTVRT
jgi:lipopolysaccharide export LptBFGC system permease protein LptF